jgi:replicative DNA helicase
MDMIVEKNRNGAQGTVKLRFDRARQRIHEVIEDA